MSTLWYKESEAGLKSACFGRREYTVMSIMSRRSFLRATGGSVLFGAATAGLLASCAPKGEPEPAGYPTMEAPGFEAPKGEWVPSYCVACHNPVCATKIRVEDGVAVEIKGDPDALMNKGMLCPRGLSVLGGLYHPYRVKTPMKRTNPEKALDNDPGWVEISWDEALNICTEKLGECLKTDPRGLFTFTGFGNEDSFKRLIFEAAFGTPNALTAAGPLCADHFGPQSSKNSKVDKVDTQYCEYVLLVGRSIGDEWGVSGLDTRRFADAVSRGMKIVCVNPRKTNSAQMGEWVPIVTGTDTAMMYGIVNVLMYEVQTYDEHFLKVRTNAPYLIAENPETLKGTKVVFSDYVRDKETGKPLVWDAAQGKAVPFDSSLGDDYALFGTYEVNGKQVKTAFEVVREYVADMTPEWAEAICGVPAKTMRTIANELVQHAHIGETIVIDGETFPYRPSVVMAPGRGANSNPLNVELFKAAEIINAILGNVDVPGGDLCLNPPDKQQMPVDADGILAALPNDMFYNQTMGSAELVFPPVGYNLACFYPHQLEAIQVVWNEILDPKSYYLNYKPQVWFTIGGGNAFRCNADPRIVEAALKTVPFNISISVWFDEMTQFADVVLPEHHALERYAIVNNEFASSRTSCDETRGLRTIHARKPAVKPVYDTRQQEDVLLILAKRLGVLPAMLGIANNAFQGTFWPRTAPGLGDYAINPGAAMGRETPIEYHEIIEAKLNKEFDGAGWDKVAKCSEAAFMVEKTSETYLWHYYPENAYRIPVYYQRNGRSAEQLRALLATNKIEFPHADIDEVLRQYSCAPAFFEFEGMHPTAEFPLKVFQFKTHFEVNDSTGLSYNPWLNDIMQNFQQDVKKALIAPSAAKKLGLADGDEVIIESTTGGTTKAILCVSEMIHPDTLGISGKWGARGFGLVDYSHEGPLYNALLNGTESDIGFMMGNINNSLPVKLYKAL